MGVEAIDHTGQRFGRLVVIGRASNSDRPRWDYRCDCGKTGSTLGYTLRSGQGKSCGCLAVEIRRAKLTTHGCTRGGKKTSTYMIWQGMLDRCTNSLSRSYRNYGGRGIALCKRWRHSFSNFLEDMGERPLGRSIDRINNDGNYEPGNCRWATASEQMFNRRVKTHCRRGHALTPDNVIAYYLSGGRRRQRICKKCRQIRISNRA